MSSPLSRKKAIEYILACYNNKDMDIREVSFKYECKRTPTWITCSFHRKRGIVIIKLPLYLLEVESRPVYSSIEGKIKLLERTLENWYEQCRKNLE